MKGNTWEQRTWQSVSCPTSTPAVGTAAEPISLAIIVVFIVTRLTDLRYSTVWCLTFLHFRHVDILVLQLLTSSKELRYLRWALMYINLFILAVIPGKLSVNWELHSLKNAQDMLNLILVADRLTLSHALDLLKELRERTWKGTASPNRNIHYHVHGLIPLQKTNTCLCELTVEIITKTWHPP